MRIHPAKAALFAIVCLISFTLSVEVTHAADKHNPVAHKTAVAANSPTYTPDGKLIFPANYREWIFLTSGLDMSYSPTATAAGTSTFDNVFVNPVAYRSFLATGTWPDKTMLVLENRRGEGNRSINRRGKTQTTGVTGFEVHVKDESRGGWAFFGFDNTVSAKKIERPASCYTCHEAHGAVDTTFVQFYPTLLPVAKQKGTLTAEYSKNLSDQHSK